LGLAVAKQIVELHGGTIGVRSDGPGRGTTFTVRLPDARRAKLGEESAAVPPSAGPSTRDGREELRGERVLVVEDDPRTLRALSILLAGADAAVTACTSAGEALRWLETGSADLLLSDIGLPEMDGYDLIRRIRREETETDRPRLCAVALTAFARDDDRRKAIDAGFDAYVAKPIDPDDLLDVLKRVRAVARGV
jgi:CheY-like chemotaxis protein